MEFQGKINRLFPVRTGTKQDGKEWTSQEFVFEYFERPDDRWSDKVLLSVMNERIREYDLHEGDEVKIGFSHSVREWQGRYFNEVRIYKFEKVKAVSTTSATSEAPKEQPQTPSAPVTKAAPKGGEDDLPF